MNTQTIKTEDSYCVTNSLGTKRYYLDQNHTILHRVNGPAIEEANGNKYWYLNGKRHRVDGPAVEFSNGNKSWWLNDKRHRVDGPAIEYTNGNKHWYLNDVQVKEEDVMKVNKEPIIETTDPYCVTDFFGIKRYYLDGKLHRIDGPAIEYTDGYKAWYLDGIRVKEEDIMKSKEPLVKTENSYCLTNSFGTKKYYLDQDHTILHRVNGPAVEYANGNKEWRLNGKLHRPDGPAFEQANGDKYWHLNGELHRANGPAVECSDGRKYWYLNGERHLVDGPAAEYPNGDKYWYLNGIQVKKEDVMGFNKEPIPSWLAGSFAFAATISIGIAYTFLMN